MRILVLLLLVAAVASAALSNAVTIQGVDRSTGQPRPFTISRFFARGEIPYYAQARVNGTPVETQCDVKTRWPDGSVQHALVSFFASVHAGDSVTVDFVNQQSGNNDGALTQQQMLALPGWNAWTEVMAMGVSKHAEARKMLAQGVWRYWLRGPVCTQVIVEGPRENATAAFSYDFGWHWDGRQMNQSSDPALNSLHPIFVLTFYRGWNGVKVEYILENNWTTKLQDQQYSLILHKDDWLTVVYAQPSITHLAKTRWRKTFWSGDEPPPVNVDYNLPYLMYSRALPTYDLTKVVSAAAITQEVSAFRSTDQGDINGKAQWEPYFPKVGGRPDIGLFPRWYVRYLYTFDPELYGVMLGNAAASGHMPIHYRESDLGRPFDAAPPPSGVPGRTLSRSRLSPQVSAFGRTLSVDARPTIRTTAQAQDTKPQDAIVPVGPVTTGRWTVDMAHQSSFVYIPYLITGDWYFLEELYFWAAYNLARGNPGATLSYNRHADWGFINDDQEIRGVAWGMRNLAHAALLAPDGSPEKAYFTAKLDNNIAIREGKYNITEGAFYEPCQSAPYDVRKETSKWCWGRYTVAAQKDNPLHFLEDGNPGLAEGLDKTQVYAGTSPWMLNYNHIVLGHLRELGFPVGKLQETMAKNLLHQIADPGYNPYLVASYRIPVQRQPNKAFIDNWAEVRAGFLDSSTAAFRTVDAQDVEHGYVHIARAAASFLPGINDGPIRGQDAWDWMNAHVDYPDLINDNPKWALVPRPQSSALAAQAARSELSARKVREQRRLVLARQKAETKRLPLSVR